MKIDLTIWRKFALLTVSLKFKRNYRMSEQNPTDNPGIEERLIALRAEFYVGLDQQSSGLVAKIAEDARQAGNAVLAQSPEAADLEISGIIESASDVSDILMPPKSMVPERWRLLQSAKKEVVGAAADHQDALLDLAKALEMRRETSLSDADFSRIDPERAVWVIEGGVNRTSVVRRTLAIMAMVEVYGDEAESQTIYQFGSTNEKRHIPKQRGDKPNPEYIVAEEIAGDHLPEDDTLNEFGLNMATALQSGYSLQEDGEGVVTLSKDGSPRLVMVAVNGMKDGFDAVHEMTGGLADRQLVIVTNGQYRPKDELQARVWAQQNGVDTLPAVVLGDEAGFSVEHRGKTITTGDRDPLVYLNEMVTLQRLDSKPIDS